MPVNQQNQVAYGQSQPTIDVISLRVVADRDPTGNDYAALATVWINTIANNVFVLTSITGGSANWESFSGGSGSFFSVTATGGDITANVGNIKTLIGNISSAGTITSGTGLVVSAGGINSTGTTTLESLSAGVMQTNSFGVVTSTNGTNGQILIGGGTAPVWNTLSSSDGSVVIANTANNINLTVSGSGSAANYITDSGTAHPNMGNLQLIHGDGNVITAGATDVVTFSLANSISVVTDIMNGGQIVSGGNISSTTGNLISVAGKVITNAIGSNTTGAEVDLIKSRMGAHIVSGDTLGNIYFKGYDTSSNPIIGAQISSVSGGTITTNQVPADLEFYTHPNTASVTPTQRMVIDSFGKVTINALDSGASGTLFNAAGDATWTGLENLFINVQNSSGSYILALEKSHGVNGIVQVGDQTGKITFRGSNGTSSYIVGSQILSTVGGTPTSNTQRIPMNLEFWTHPDSTSLSQQRLVINVDGSLLLNPPDSPQTVAFTITYGDLDLQNNNNDSSHTNLQISKSRAGSAVMNSDILGTLLFAGDDGTGSLFSAASITSTVSGTPTAGNIPGTLAFSTTPPGSSLVERLFIDENGTVTINPATSSFSLLVEGTTVMNAKLDVFNDDIEVYDGNVVIDTGTLEITYLGVGVMQTNGSGSATSNTGTDGQVLIASSTPGVGPSWQNIESSNGSISIRNASNLIDINLSTSFVNFWTTITATTVSVGVGKGYILNNTVQVVATLPAAALVGETIGIIGKGTGGWKLLQNTGQTIHFGGDNTTTSVGFVSSSTQYDCIELVCITANTDFVIRTFAGSPVLT